MLIGFIGSGPVATQLATLFEASGAKTRLSHRQPPDSFAAAVADADIVVVAIPYRACVGALPSLATALRGKVVVDATNPLNEDYSPIVIAGGRSASEEIQGLLPESRIVKAFNTVFADNMRADSLHRGDVQAAAFICGDDAAANQGVVELATAAGFDAIDAGPLVHARYLEAMAHLNIALAFGKRTWNARSVCLYILVRLLRPSSFWRSLQRGRHRDSLFTPRRAPTEEPPKRDDTPRSRRDAPLRSS